jgi:ATP-binding cassette subfamily B protein
MTILSSLMMLSMTIVQITMSSASAKRIVEVLDEKADICDPADGGITHVPNGSIDFNNVSFSYNTQAKESDQKTDIAYAIRDITLHIHPGETIGIIGGTGCGKSTLAMLISRLYDATEGTVSIGGIDVRQYQVKALRNEVAMVLQNNQLFSGNIIDNLRWGKADATEEECREACRQACADEFIEQKPEGYHTFIEQNGANFSGGQKQRLCIARALLKKPKVLILDDSTSACDTMTDAKIRKAFRQAIPDTTKLIVAQRIQSVNQADRIIVMQSGRISGFDTHENLLANNAIYREIYDTQMRQNEQAMHSA